MLLHAFLSVLLASTCSHVWASDPHQAPFEEDVSGPAVDAIESKNAAPVEDISLLLEAAKNGPSQIEIEKAVDEMLAQAAAMRDKEDNVSSSEEESRKHPVMKAVAKKVVKGIAETVFKVLKRQSEVRGAYCGFHAAEAAQYLTRASIQISMAVKACVPERNVNLMDVHHVNGFMSQIKSPCTADVMDIMGSLVWVAGYLSLVASECASHAKIERVCAGMTSVLVGALGQTAAAGSVAMSMCSTDPDAPRQEWVMPTRRLTWSKDAYSPAMKAWDAKEHMTKAQRDQEMAICVVDASQVASALGVFALAFDQTIMSCVASDAVHNIPGIGVQVDEWCMVEVSYVLYSLLSASSFIASALSHCSRAIGVRMGSECVAAITRITSAVAGLPLIAGGLDLSCPSSAHFLGNTLGPLKDVALQITALGRRLSASSQEEAVTAGNVHV